MAQWRSVILLPLAIYCITAGHAETKGSDSVEIEEEIDKIVTYPVFSPPVDSPAVREQREELLGALDLKAFVEDLGRMGKYIRVAYNGIGAAGPKFTKLQIKVQKLGFELSDLCSKSGVTISRYVTTTRTILFELKAAYQFLLKGREKMALVSFSTLAKLAGKMAKAAEDLERDFRSQEVKVGDVLEETKLAGSGEDLRAVNLKAQQEQAKVDREIQERLAKEHEKLEAEFREARRSLERKEDKELSAKTGFLNRLGNVITSSVGLGKLFDDEGSAQARATRWRQKRLEKLDEEKAQRKLKQDALQSMAQLVYKIKSMEGEKEVAKVAVIALHETAGSLHKIIRLLQQAVLFWTNLKIHCENLADDEIRGNIEKFVDEVSSREERMEHWASNQFKERMFIYVSKWVALHSVSSEYLDQIKRTQKQLWDYIAESPTHEESRQNLQELADNFKEDLIAAQVEVKQQSSKAEEEEKWLKIKRKQDEL